MDLLQKAASDLLARIDLLCKDPSAYELNRFLVRLSNDIETLEMHYPRELIRNAIMPLRAIAARSPFLHRAQNWPRGYPGDFQTIEYILNGINNAPGGTLAYMIEEYFLDSAICQQHRNKVQAQAELINAVLCSKRGCNILSVGCGSSADLESNKELLKSAASRITLADSDAEALEHSRQRIGAGGFSLSLLHGNILRIIHRITDKFDLIIIGGVFDYLDDKMVRSIIGKLAALLLPGGKLFFTNIADGNPYRVSMEYLADWHLIERSEEDLRELIRHSGAVFVSESIRRDETTLACLVTLETGMDSSF